MMDDDEQFYRRKIADGMARAGWVAAGMRGRTAECCGRVELYC